MDIISFEYAKKRREFGRHPVFGETVNAVVSIPTEPEASEQWLPRKTTTVLLDCVPVQACHDVSTDPFEQHDRGMQHTDGGWPVEVKGKEAQDFERYLRRVCNQEGFNGKVAELVRRAEEPVMRNNAIDLLEEYFADDQSVEDSAIATEPPAAHNLTVLRDPHDVKRVATQCVWNPDGSTRLAVAYSVTQFQSMPENAQWSSYIWDVDSPNEPEMEIVPKSSSPLTCVAFHPRTTDHMVAGSYNGLVSFWDLRKGNEPQETSQIEKSHHDPVTAIAWLQSRSGNEFVSASSDGRLFWWDIRRLSSGPIDSMKLQPDYGISDHPVGPVFGVTCLEYRSDAGATRYLMGTEQGQVVLIDRKAKKDAGSTKSIKAIFGGGDEPTRVTSEEDAGDNGPETGTGRHHSPLYSIRRHPTESKFFLTIGDWTARVWMEDLKTPIFTTRYDSTYLTGGCWSPTRFGVFFITKENGTLDVWDIFYKQNEPVYSTKVGEVPITSVDVHRNGSLIALGAADGSTSIMKLNESLSAPQYNEKQAVQLMLARERERARTLEIRNMVKRKAAAKAAKKGAQAKRASGGAAGAKKGAGANATVSEEELAQITHSVETDFFAAIGMNPAEAAARRTKRLSDSRAKQQAEDDDVPHLHGANTVT